MKRAAACVVLAAATAAVAAHGVGAHDGAVAAGGAGLRPALFAYLGAKHMLTGVDHLLFLLGMVFLLRGAADVVGYATLFAAGHSATLVVGVLAGWQVDVHAVDAAIGLSVVYKAADNLGLFQALCGWRPPPRAAVALFGLVHGLGLASRVGELRLAPAGLLGNLLAFNLGVEAGQLAALTLIAFALAVARRGAAVPRLVAPVNAALAVAGLVIVFGQFSALAWAVGEGA
jgi:hypothetical protein